MIIDVQKYCAEDRVWHQPELASKIIQSMLKDGNTILRSKESRSAIENGLYNFLDELCAHWGWNKANITIETTNMVENHTEYNVKFIVHCDQMRKTDFDKIVDVSWNKEKVYGMFIGRPTVARIRGAINHNFFKYKDLGVTSCNADFKNSLSDQTVGSYLRQTNQTYSNITAITPYSDISKVMIPPIVPPYTLENWSDVYKQIGVELVFETSETFNNFCISEKIWRPILYKRPFFLISGRGSIDRLKNVKNFQRRPAFSFDNIVSPALIEELYSKYREMRFFENTIDISYDYFEGVDRVDQVFKNLESLISSGKIYNILEDCQEDIEHNYNTLQSIIPIYQEIFTQSQNAFDYSTWPKVKNDK
jgi:hypothetical protein